MFQEKISVCACVYTGWREEERKENNKINDANIYNKWFCIRAHRCSLYYSCNFSVGLKLFLNKVKYIYAFALKCMNVYRMTHSSLLGIIVLIIASLREVVSHLDFLYLDWHVQVICIVFCYNVNVFLTDMRFTNSTLTVLNLCHSCYKCFKYSNLEVILTPLRKTE